MPRISARRAKGSVDTLTGSLFALDEFEPARPEPLEPPVPKPRDTTVGLKWSYSRRNLLEKCPRQYYYYHYGALKKTAIEETDKELLGQLKNLSNRHFLAGQHLHKAISDYFEQAQKGGKLSPGAMAARALSAFGRDVATSRRAASGAPPRGRAVGKYLRVMQEHFYALPNAETLCAEAEDKLRRALHHFSTHPVFAEAREAGEAPGAVVEKSFELDVGCAVKGKIDLMFFEGRALTLVDWKIGDTSDDGEDSLQLAIYALWACREYGLAPEDVKVFKAFLGSGDLVPFAADARGLQAARVRVLQDVERMAFAERYGHAGVAAAFTACAQLGICATCPFLKACPEGKECLDGRDDEAEAADGFLDEE